MSAMLLHQWPRSMTLRYFHHLHHLHHNRQCVEFLHNLVQGTPVHFQGLILMMQHLWLHQHHHQGQCFAFLIIGHQLYIMECIEQPTPEEQKRALNSSIRNEIIRALGTHMFSYNPKPTKAFCTEVARMLVKRYPFMRDIGRKESGYVSAIMLMLCRYTLIVGFMGEGGQEAGNQ